MAHALNPSTVVKRSDNQVFCVLDNEVALLNLDRARYFGLNDTAPTSGRASRGRARSPICARTFSPISRSRTTSVARTCWTFWPACRMQD